MLWEETTTKNPHQPGNRRKQQAIEIRTTGGQEDLLAANVQGEEQHRLLDRAFPVLETCQTPNPPAYCVKQNVSIKRPLLAAKKTKIRDFNEIHCISFKIGQHEQQK